MLLAPLLGFSPSFLPVIFWKSSYGEEKLPYCYLRSHFRIRPSYARSLDKEQNEASKSVEKLDTFSKIYKERAFNWLILSF